MLMRIPINSCILFLFLSMGMHFFVFANRLSIFSKVNYAFDI